MKDLTSGVKSEAPLRSKEGGAESVYYIHTGCSGIASRFSLKARRKMYDLFAQTFILSPELKILDVGVTSDRQNPESNYFEQFYPYKHRITCVGTEDAFWLEEHYPGLTFHKIKPDAKLPFEDQSFDIAFSNAVIEHAGHSAAQQRFVSEVQRVSKAWFITTPNRWFPVETHTMLPLLHYLPTAWWRTCLRRLGYAYYSHESNLNLLDRRSIRHLFPDAEQTKIIPVRTLGWVSNLVALKPLPPAPSSRQTGER